MKTPKRIWSNPYKLKLWLGSLDHELLNDRQKRELLHFLGWGPRGCPNWNYQLALIFHKSKRTIRRDLRHLEKYHFVLINGALGKHRRIVGIPYPTKAAWMAKDLQEDIRKLAKKWGDKNVPHKRRLKRHQINQLTYDLLYSSAEKATDMESEKTSDGPYRSSAARLGCSGGEARIPQPLEAMRKELIDRLIRVGHSRERAINLANIAFEKSMREKKSNKS